MKTLFYIKLEEYLLAMKQTHGFSKTLTQTLQNPYPQRASGFAMGRVGVQLKYPRVTPDNP
jgi:hypothetical protein